MDGCIKGLLNAMCEKGLQNYSVLGVLLQYIQVVYKLGKKYSAFKKKNLIDHPL